MNKYIIFVQTSWRIEAKNKAEPQEVVRKSRLRRSHGFGALIFGGNEPWMFRKVYSAMKNDLLLFLDSQKNFAGAKNTFYIFILLLAPRSGMDVYPVNVISKQRNFIGFLL